MFAPVRPHTLAPGPTVRLGHRLPPDSVNVALCRFPSLTPETSITIVDDAGLMFENRDRAEEVHLLYPDASGLLYLGGELCDLPTWNPTVTRVFAEETPLFFSHELTLYVTSPNPTVRIVGPQDSEVPEEVKTMVTTRPASTRGLYKATVHTNFQMDPDYPFKAIYNGVSLLNGRTVVPENHEPLDPQLAGRFVADPSDLDEANPVPAYFLAAGKGFANSRIYASQGIVAETRTPIMFQYSLRVEVIAEGETFIQHGPWISATVLNPSSLLSHEVSDYQNDALRLSASRITDLLRPYLPDLWRERPGAIYRYSVVSTNPEVTCFGRPDGQGPPYAKTAVDTGKPPQVTKIRGYRWQPYSNPQTLPPILFEIMDGANVVATYPLDLNGTLELNGQSECNARQLYNLASDIYGPGLNLNATETQSVDIQIRPVGATPFNLAFRKEGALKIGTDGYARVRLTDILADQVTLQVVFAGAPAHFVPVYAVRYLDKSQLRLLRPSPINPLDNWYLRVQNGRFTKTVITKDGPKTLLYCLPGCADNHSVYAGYTKAGSYRHLDLNPYVGHSYTKDSS